MGSIAPYSINQKKKISCDDTEKGNKKMNLIVGVVVLIIIILIVLLIIFRKNPLISKILNLLLLPFKLILKIFGIGGAKPSAEIPSLPPIANTTTTTEVIKHEIGTCPPCNVQCPPTPSPTDTKPLEMELKYLKDMVKFTGAMAKRENAINAQYRELYPGFSVMSPDVRRLSYEYSYLKNQLKEDENEWTYFKNYFTKLSGIPSSSSAVHYDLML